MSSKIVCIKKQTSYLFLSLIIIAIAIGVLSHVSTSRKTTLSSRAAPYKVEFGGQGDKCMPGADYQARTFTTTNEKKPCDPAKEYLYCDYSLDYFLQFSQDFPFDKLVNNKLHYFTAPSNEWRCADKMSNNQRGQTGRICKENGSCNSPSDSCLYLSQNSTPEDLKNYIVNKRNQFNITNNYGMLVDLDKQINLVVQHYYSLQGFHDETYDPGICIPSSSVTKFVCGSDGQPSCESDVDGCETQYYDTVRNICTNECGGAGQMGCPVPGSGQNGMLPGYTYFSQCADPNHFVWTNLKDASDELSCKPLPSQSDFLDTKKLDAKIEFKTAHDFPRNAENNSKVQSLKAIDTKMKQIEGVNNPLLYWPSLYLDIETSTSPSPSKYYVIENGVEKYIKFSLNEDKYYGPLILPSTLQVDLSNYQATYKGAGSPAPLSHLFAIKINEISEKVDFYTSDFKFEKLGHIAGANYANPASYMTVDCDGTKVNLPVYVGQMSETDMRACVYGVFYSTFEYPQAGGMDAFRKCGFKASIEDGSGKIPNAKRIKLDKLHLEMQNNTGPITTWDYDLTKSEGRELLVDFRIFPTPTERPSTRR